MDFMQEGQTFTVKKTISVNYNHQEVTCDVMVDIVHGDVSGEEGQQIKSMKVIKALAGEKPLMLTAEEWNRFYDLCLEKVMNTLNIFDI